MKKLMCDGCGHPSGKKSLYGLKLCTVCIIVKEESETETSIYIQTLGEEDKKFVRTIEKRKG